MQQQQELELSGLLLLLAAAAAAASAAAAKTANRGFLPYRLLFGFVCFIVLFVLHAASAACNTMKTETNKCK